VQKRVLYGGSRRQREKRKKACKNPIGDVQNYFPKWEVLGKLAQKKKTASSEEEKESKKKILSPEGKKGCGFNKLEKETQKKKE